MKPDDSFKGLTNEMGSKRKVQYDRDRNGHDFMCWSDMKDEVPAAQGKKKVHHVASGNNGNFLTWGN